MNRQTQFCHTYSMCWVSDSFDSEWVSEWVSSIGLATTLMDVNIHEQKWTFRVMVGSYFTHWNFDSTKPRNIRLNFPWRCYQCNTLITQTLNESSNSEMYSCLDSECDDFMRTAWWITESTVDRNGIYFVQKLPKSIIWFWLILRC